MLSAESVLTHISLDEAVRKVRNLEKPELILKSYQEFLLPILFLHTVVYR